MDYLIEKLAKEFNIRPKQVEDTIELIDGGNTIPFIARYRKEVTGNLSDILLRDLDTRLTYLRKLEKRKEDIAASIEEQGKLTPELRAAITKAETLQEAEDLYLPYKQKKKTRASIAKEKGLEPLAMHMYLQIMSEEVLEAEAEKYVDEEKGVATAADALQGAMDIIAEMISENADYRKKIRHMVALKGMIKSAAAKGMEEEKTEFENYYDYNEPIKKVANHRMLAINRGEKRKVLTVKVVDPAEEIIDYLKKSIVKKGASTYLVKAVEDSYKRLILPSIEREIRTELKEKAEESAIKMFALNLKKLLLQPPFKGKTTLGFDPAFRTGCKIAVLDSMGTLLDTATIYPTEPRNETAKSEKVLLDLIEKYKVDIISIGN
ncbi:MAG: Tex-like N-terminal domain-containing protein, partial [Eubacterium sp.]